ncbi:hypothetical protein WUBG_16950 [Wuchereria bancrofti]|uniref:MobA/MobL protein domain-containing protein n=1 Tax=Wuchereria bancrofti TaxID=6293 RepID=J9DR86_WUCBA|nr:hypothetical protein WUBG_16950 [Wuchereria bancrofti]
MLDELCQNLVKKHGVIVDAAIHAPHTDGGSDERNYHAHIMFTTRAIDPQTGNFSAKKYRDFSRDSGTKTVCHWRESFADLTNQHLEKAGYDVRVDHRSYKDQKNGLEATKHEGYEVTQLRRMGVETEISVSNDLIKQNNFERTQDPQLLKGLEQEIFASEKIVSTLKNERDEMNVEINKNNLAEAQERVQNFKKLMMLFTMQLTMMHQHLRKSKQLESMIFIEKVSSTLQTSIFSLKTVLHPSPKEKSQQEEADRSAKSQQEILDYQNGVQKLAKNAELGAVQKGDKQSYLKLVRERYEKIQDVFTKERSHTDRVRYASCPGKESFQDIYKLIQADKK